MILAAGLLVLLGLGLFVGGIVTGTTALYWACVAACGLAAVLLVLARLRLAREAGDFDRRVSQAPADAPGSRVPGAPPVVPAEEGTPAREPGAPTPEPPEPPGSPAGATAVRVTGPEPELPVEPAAGDRAPEAPAAVAPPPNGRLVDVPPARRGAHEPRETPVDPATGEPGEEDVEVTDLLLVVDLDDEVLVVDEHPRYHMAGCPSLEGREAVGLPMVEARTDGFTPCALCRPVRHLADTERARRRSAHGN